MTYTRRRNFLLREVFGARRSPASVIALRDLEHASWLGRYSSGPAGLRAPLRRSRSCSSKYVFGQARQRGIFRPPWPVGVWQNAQAITAGLRPFATTSGIGK